MRHGNYEETRAENVEAYDSKGTTIRTFITKDEAPHFMMRRFEIAPGGVIGLHGHPEEHEIYILQGEVILTDEKGNRERIKKDEFVFVPPNEKHGYINEGDETVAFICVIPKL
ncbi:MAG: cupin domain-containing protein [Candidatus Hodarchaeota archaeon]